MNPVPNYIAPYADTVLHGKYAESFIAYFELEISAADRDLINAITNGKGLTSREAAKPYLDLTEGIARALHAGDALTLSEILNISEAYPIGKLVNVKAIVEKFEGRHTEDLELFLLGEVGQVTNCFMKALVEQENLQSRYLAYSFLTSIKMFLPNFEMTLKMTKFLGSVEENVDNLDEAVSNSLHSAQQIDAAKTSLERQENKTIAQIDRLNALHLLSFQRGENEVFMEAFNEVFALQYGHGIESSQMLIDLIGQGTTLDVNPELFATGVEKRFYSRLSAADAHEFRQEFSDCVKKVAERKQWQIPSYMLGQAR